MGFTSIDVRVRISAFCPHFTNTGKDYVIDLQDMIDDVPDAKVFYDREVTKASIEWDSQYPGTHIVVSPPTSK